MRKKMLATTMALTMTALSATAYAQEPAVTAEELFQDAAAYMLEAEQLQMNVAVDGAGTVSLASEGGSSSSFGGAAKGSMQLERTSNPTRVHVSGDMTNGALGISYKVNGELYLEESEDGMQLDMYADMNIGPESSGWIHESGAAGDFWSEMGVASEEEFKERLTDVFQQELPELQFDWKVEEQEDAYEVSLNNNYAEVFRVLEAYAEEQNGETLFTEEEWKLFEEVMSCIQIDTAAVFDKETHALESLKVDLGATDTQKLGEKITELMKSEITADNEEALESFKDMVIGLELENALFEMTCSYENVPEITVPQEVIDAAAEAEVLTEQNAETDAAAEVTVETAENTEATETETIAPQTVETEEITEN